MVVVVESPRVSIISHFHEQCEGCFSCAVGPLVSRNVESFHQGHHKLIYRCLCTAREAIYLSHLPACLPMARMMVIYTEQNQPLIARCRARCWSRFPMAQHPRNTVPSLLCTRPRGTQVARQKVASSDCRAWKHPPEYVVTRSHATRR